MEGRGQGLEEGEANEAEVAQDAQHERVEKEGRLRLGMLGDEQGHKGHDGEEYACGLSLGIGRKVFMFGTSWRKCPRGDQPRS